MKTVTKPSGFYGGLRLNNSKGALIVEAETLKQKRIVFVRDRNKDSYKIFNKLKKEYPNSKVIDSSESSIDKNATDIVVIMTQYVCHNSYWYAKGSAKNKDIPIIHCRYINTDRVLDTILHKYSYNNARSK